MDQRTNNEPFTKIGIANFIYYRHAIRERQSGRISGKILDVDSLRPYLQEDYPVRLKPGQAQSNVHLFLCRWAESAARERLTFRSSVECVDGTFTRLTPRTDGEYGKLWWGMLRSYHELLCLAAYRQPIDNLIASLCPDEPGPLVSLTQKAALKRLLTLSKAFATADWMRSLNERATSNNDRGFFQAFQQGLSRNLSPKHAAAAEQRMAIMLLWYLGGKDMLTRKDFQWQLLRRGILTTPMLPESFETMLSKLGLTDNNLTIA